MNTCVSIIIPNYNHALFLKQRIDSVLSQTYQDFEVIILDDCSIDTSREIIEQYRSHPKISSILYNQQNSGGLFKQWIKGIKAAKGDYIWIAESDDYAAENFLEETLAVIEKDPSAGMVFTNSNIVNIGGKFLETTEESKKESFAQLAEAGNTIDRTNAASFLISEMIIANASSALFRKSSLLSVDFTELAKFVNTGDRFVYTRIALQSKICYIPTPLNFMRSHEHNTTKKSFENGNIHKDRLRVLNYYFAELFSEHENRERIIGFYKNNFISFITHGSYRENIELLNKMKAQNSLPRDFYYLVRSYLNLFRKKDGPSGLLRSIFYRILRLYHLTDKQYQN